MGLGKTDGFLVVLIWDPVPLISLLTLLSLYLSSPGVSSLPGFWLVM